MPETGAITSSDLKMLEKIFGRYELDKYTAAARDYVLHAIQLLPMRVVLEAIPGDTIIEKCHRAGISRNTWYRWENGIVRPTHAQAVRISELTKIPPEKFQGRR